MYSILTGADLRERERERTTVDLCILYQRTQYVVCEIPLLYIELAVFFRPRSINTATKHRD